MSLAKLRAAVEKADSECPPDDDEPARIGDWIILGLDDARAILGESGRMRLVIKTLATTYNNQYAREMLESIEACDPFYPTADAPCVVESSTSETGPTVTSLAIGK